VIIAEMFDRQPDFWPEDGRWGNGPGRGESLGKKGGRLAK
jgi:hypothetical protein